MVKSDKIYIAGHNGMVGSALWRNLESNGFYNLIGLSSKKLDLRDQTAVRNFFAQQKPEYVFLAAAHVGGIYANNAYPTEFLYDNLMIELNVIHASFAHDVKKLMFLGSSCIYPKFAPQPITEDSLLTGPLEPTNEAYAIAKIAGVKLCESINRQYKRNFISVMPTNLYGINDNYHPENSHVLPALLRRFHEAKVNNFAEVTVWGSGMPLREFMFADDLADACVFLMENYHDIDLINVGSGEEISIKELSIMISKVVGFKGQIIFDKSKPDGTPRKLMNSDKLRKLGFVPKTSLEEGLGITYRDFLRNN